MPADESSPKDLPAAPCSENTPEPSSPANIRPAKRIRLQDWALAKPQQVVPQVAGFSERSASVSGVATGDSPALSDVTVARSGQDVLYDDSLKWAAGQARAAVDDRYIMVAINTDWIPRPMFGRLGIMLRDDGRFGPEDPLNWPQLYCPRRPYLALVPRRPPPGTPFAFLWDALRPEDFVRANEDLNGAAYGYLASDKVARLRTVVESTRQTSQRFRHFSPFAKVAVVDDLNRLVATLHSTFTLFGVPSTFRDLIRLWSRFHRSWAECWAFMRWHEHSRPRSETAVVEKLVDIVAEPGVNNGGVIGTITNDPSIAQKWMAVGVPVWWLVLRHAVSPEQLRNTPLLSLREPSHVETATALVRGEMRGWATAGTQHIDAIWRESETVLDIERNPLPADFALEDENSASHTLYSQHKGKGQGSQRVRGTERFRASGHPLVPVRLPVWQTALEAVDLTQSCEARIGFWFPEPELVVTSAQPFRLLVNLSNWLSIRVSLFSKLGRRSLFHPVGPECWRVFLTRFPEQTPEEAEQSQKKREAGLAASASAGTSKKRRPDRAEAHQGQEKKRYDHKQRVCAYFGALLDRGSQPFALRTPPVASFYWRGRVLPLNLEDAKAGREPLAAEVIQEIGWELSEVAFRVELHELDRCVTSAAGADAYTERCQLLGQVFPGEHWSRPVIPLYPDRLQAEDAPARTLRLDAFRRLLLRWPGCPASFGQSFDERTTGAMLDWFEKEAAKFYCRVAYRKWGRAAAVPRQPPVSLQ